MTIHIEHQARRKRFVATVDGQECICEYELAGGVVDIVHTLVPEALEGRGIASALVRALLDHAKAQGLKVRPACSFAKAYMHRHPETGSLLA